MPVYVDEEYRGDLLPLSYHAKLPVTVAYEFSVFLLIFMKKLFDNDFNRC